MKLETLIYDNLKKVIPLNSIKTVMFAKVANTNYEIYFYSYLADDNNPKQCFSLAEEGVLDENDLDNVFSKIAEDYRKSDKFKEDKNNIITFTIEKNEAKLKVEYYDKGERLNGIKKAWIGANL